ncbi:hypothetical protein NUH87_22915 [Pseudomonas batumici]|uniref:hypothetical protein n=1 Tax=Pseudomonas batumici TaxID=226910 RepID=UPI0030CC35F8
MNASDVPRIQRPSQKSDLPSHDAVLFGSGFPGATVEIWQQNGSLLGQVLVKNYSWAIKLTTDLPVGPFTFSIRQTLDGVISNWLNFSYNVVENATMSTSDIPNIDYPVSGSHLPSHNTSLSGSGFSGATVEIWQQNGSKLGEGSVDHFGKWSTELAADLPLGPFTFSIRQTFGEIISDWKNFSYDVYDTGVVRAPIIMTPGKNAQVSTQSLLISGYSTPGATISIYPSGAAYCFGTTLTNVDSEWTLLYDPELSAGHYEITAMATGADGTQSGWADPVPFDAVVLHNYAWAVYQDGYNELGSIVKLAYKPNDNDRGKDAQGRDGRPGDRWIEVPEYAKTGWVGPENGPWCSPSAFKTGAEVRLPSMKKIALALAMDADNYKVEIVEIDENNVTIGDIREFLLWRIEKYGDNTLVGELVSTSAMTYDELKADQSYNSTRIPQHQRLARLLLSAVSGDASFGYSVPASQRQVLTDNLLIRDLIAPMIVYHRDLRSKYPGGRTSRSDIESVLYFTGLKDFAYKNFGI